MNKTYIAIAAVVIVLVGAYFVLGSQTGMKTYSSAELGFEFAYPTGTEGYELIERSSPEDTLVRRVLILMRTKDVGDIPAGGEGPPTITILVLANPENQNPQEWAEAHAESSNMNIKSGEVAQTSVGGVNAIRYKTDGLYASHNVIAAHGQNIYVFNGMYMDEDSAQYRDFGPLLESVRFIP